MSFGKLNRVLMELLTAGLASHPYVGSLSLVLIQGQKSSRWESTAAYPAQAACVQFLGVNLFCHYFRATACAGSSGKVCEHFHSHVWMAAPPAQTGRNPGCVCSLAGETVIQRQEIVALSNEMGMLCFGFSSILKIKMLYVILKDYRSQKIKARASHVFLQHSNNYN